MVLVSYEGIKIKIVGALGKPWLTNIFPAFRKILYILYKQTYKVTINTRKGDVFVLQIEATDILSSIFLRVIQLKAHSSSFTTLYEDVN